MWKADSRSYHRWRCRSQGAGKNRGGGGGYSEFEPIHQRSDEDDEEEETASLTSGRTYSSMSSSSTASGASQMSRDDEVRSMQSRSRMLARMQKQTSRAQHRTNIRERYGLQPDMLDTAFVLGSKILMNKGNASSARTKSAEGTSAAKRLMFW